VYVEYFVDQGTTSMTSTEHDLISLIYTGALSDQDFGWPAGFPYTCPPASGTASLSPVYLELDGGDINVQDALAS
jgi:hypothetical protein